MQVSELMRSYGRFRSCLSWFLFSSIMLEIVQVPYMCPYMFLDICLLPDA